MAAFLVCAARWAGLPFIAEMNSKLKTLRAVVLCCLFAASAFGQAPAQNLRRLPVPGRSWAVEITLPAGFNVRQDALSADGRGRKLSADNEAEGYILTIMIAPASTPRVSSQDLRDLSAERLRSANAIRRDEFKIGAHKQTPTIEYLVREHKGQPLNQKHLHAYLSRDNIWIDIHFSKTNFRDGDEKIFHTMLDSLRLTDSAGRALEPPR